MSHRKAAVIGLVVVLLASTAPFATSAGTPILVCFRVENVVGWPVEDAAVRAVDPAAEGTDAATPLVGTTDAHGYVELHLPASPEPYAIVVHDNKTPASAGRNGIVYQPATGTVNVRTSQIQEAACDGKAGIAMNDGQPVVLATPPQLGFLEVFTRDGVVGDKPALADTNVTPVLSFGIDGEDATASEAGFARTNVSGVLRMGCSTVGPALTLTFRRESFLLQQLTASCLPVGASKHVNNLTVDMWRTPVSVEVTVEEVLRLGEITGLEGTFCVPASVRPCGNFDPAEPMCLRSPATTPCQDAQVLADAATNAAGAPPVVIPNLLGEELTIPANGSLVSVTGRPATISASFACGRVEPRQVNDPVPAFRPGNLERPRTLAQLNAQAPPVTVGPTAPYMCESVVDSAGHATLLLPWAEEGVGAYTLTATLDGFAPASDENVVLRRGEIVAHVPLKLERGLVQIAQVIYDVHNATLGGATLVFKQGARETTVGTSDPTGVIAGSLHTGPGTITLTHPAKETRTCTADVVSLADGAGAFANVEPWYCFMLVSQGTAAALGRVVDAPLADLGTLVPISDLELCVSASACDNTCAPGPCAQTDPAGHFTIELPPFSPLGDIRIASGQDWSDFAEIPSDSTGAAGTVTVITSPEPPLKARRAQVAITVHVLQASDRAPIADASVRIERGSIRADNEPLASPFRPRNVTDGSGINVSANLQTFWTRLNGSSQFDLPDSYVATATKFLGAQHENVTHFPTRSASAFHLYADEKDNPGGRHVDLLMDPEGNWFQIGVTARDLNSGGSAAVVANASLVAPGVGGPGDPPRSSGPQNVTVTPGQMLLYGGHAGGYRACTRSDALYGAFGSAGCQTITPGTTTSIELTVRRTIATIHVRATDPHTGWNITNYNVSLVGALSCAPGQPLDGLCAAQTPTAAPFEATLAVPWTASPSDMCLSGTSNDATRVTFTPAVGQTDAHGERVPFQEARYCQAWEAGGRYWYNFTPYRAPAAVAYAGSVVHARGTGDVSDAAPFAGALLTARAERPEECHLLPEGVPATPVDPACGSVVFQCDPVAVNASPGVGFPDCDTTTSDSDGHFSLRLPAVGANTTWAVTASAPGHYPETYNRWSALDVISPTFVMYPRAFQAVVRVTIVDPGLTQVRCVDDDVDFPVNVTLRDLGSTSTNVNDATYWNPRATAQPDGTCIAVLDVPDWFRDPVALPAAAGLSWPKSTHPFLVRATQRGHDGGAIVWSFGPADADRFVNVTLVRRTTQIQPHEIPDAQGNATAIQACIEDEQMPGQPPASTACEAYLTALGLLPDLPQLPDVEGNVTAILACIESDETPGHEPAVAACDAFRTASALLPEAPDVEGNVTAILACVEGEDPEHAPATTACEQVRLVQGQVDGILALLASAQQNATAIQGCVVDETAAEHDPAAMVCLTVSSARDEVAALQQAITDAQTSATENATAVQACVQAAAAAEHEPAATLCAIVFTVSPPAAEFSVTGRVFDGNGRAAASLGLPATVTLTGTSEGCTESVEVATDAQGQYTAALPCAGAYSVAAQPLAQLATHWHANLAAGTVTVTAAEPTASKSIGLERTTGSIAIRIVGGCETIDGNPVDTEQDPGEVPCENVSATFPAIKWGVYTLTPRGAGIIGLPTGAVVWPGIATAAVVVSR